MALVTEPREVVPGIVVFVSVKVVDVERDCFFGRGTTARASVSFAIVKIPERVSGTLSRVSALSVHRNSVRMRSVQAGQIVMVSFSW